MVSTKFLKKLKDDYNIEFNNEKLLDSTNVEEVTNQ